MDGPRAAAEIARHADRDAIGKVLHGEVEIPVGLVSEQRMPFLSGGQAADGGRRHHHIEEAEEGFALTGIAQDGFELAQGIVQPAGIEITAAIQDSQRLAQVAQFVAQACNREAHDFFPFGWPGPCLGRFENLVHAVRQRNGLARVKLQIAAGDAELQGRESAFGRVIAGEAGERAPDELAEDRAPARRELGVAAHHFVGGGEEAGRVLVVAEDEAHDQRAASGLVAFEIDGREGSGRNEADLEGGKVDDDFVAGILPDDGFAGLGHVRTRQCGTNPHGEVGLGQGVADGEYGNHRRVSGALEHHADLGGDCGHDEDGAGLGLEAGGEDFDLVETVGEREEAGDYDRLVRLGGDGALVFYRLIREPDFDAAIERSAAGGQQRQTQGALFVRPDCHRNRQATSE